jgi:trehalose-phosphatase
MIPSALNQIEQIIPARGRTLALFFDYDGTLTPIVDRPEEAELADSTRQILRVLAKQLPVAILSGRDLNDLQRRIGIDGIIYAGSHGFDIAGPRELRKEMAAEFLPIIDLAEKELGEKLAPIPGALLERKRSSLAAHYRLANEPGAKAVKQAVDDVAARYRQLRRTAGKKVYELQPDIDWNKGRALLWLLEILEKERPQLYPLYIGDDLTDEDAFRAVRESGIGIVVTDLPRPTAARYALKNPTEVERFLHELAARA